MSNREIAGSRADTALKVVLVQARVHARENRETNQHS